MLCPFTAAQQARRGRVRLPRGRRSRWPRRVRIPSLRPTVVAPLYRTPRVSLTPTPRWCSRVASSCVTEGVMRASSRPGDPAPATAASGTAGDESKTAPAGDADSFGDPVDDDDVAETKHVVVQEHVDGGEPGVDACVSYSFTQGMNKPLSTTSPEVVDIPLITTSYVPRSGRVC